MQELVPLLSGFTVGVALGMVRPALRLRAGAILAVTLGVLATVVTGEFETSWAFILIDIPLVGIAAAFGLLVARQITRRVLGTG